MVSIPVAGGSDDLSPDTDIIQVLQDVRQSSVQAGFDGDSAMCLIEVSHALHRASVAIGRIGPGSVAPSLAGRRPELDCDGNVLEGIDRDTAQGYINKAIALVDGLNEVCSAQPRDWETRLPLMAAGVSDSSRPDGAHGVVTENADAGREILERIASELNMSVIRGSFEASLILQGALEFNSDHEVAQRISTVIDLLDENIRDVRNTIFGFGFLGGVTDAVSKQP